MANCNDVAKYANVSRQTVSRVINNSGYVSAQARERVLDAIEKLNYYPNTAARSLKSTKSKSIGLIIPDPYNDFYIKISNYLQKKLNDMNYSLLILFSDEDTQTEEKCLSTLIEHRVELLLFTPTSANKKFLQLLKSYNIKIIQLFRYLYDSFTSITIDDEYGSYLAAASLLKQGHRRLLLIEEMHSFDSLRLQGLKRALLEFDVPFCPEMYLPSPKDSTGIETIKSVLLKYRPTAVIAVAKPIEISFIRAITELKYEVNKDVSVIFYDDNEIADIFNISVVTHNFDNITDTIVHAITECLTGDPKNPHIVLTPFLLNKTGSTYEARRPLII